MKTVIVPPRRIFIVFLLLAVLMVICLSWFGLLFILAGVIGSSLYMSWATPRWRIWAYDHVTDIHQLQRSAEMAGLLPLHSHDRITGFTGMRQRSILEELQQRFNEQYDFIDDPSIPEETHIYPTKAANTNPIMTLNAVGIWTLNDGFFAWGQITNELIATVNYVRRNFATGGKSGAGANKVFRFDFSDGNFEIFLSNLYIEPWELDLLLYIYRGRFASAGKQEVIDKLLPGG